MILLIQDYTEILVYTNHMPTNKEDILIVRLILEFHGILVHSVRPPAVLGSQSQSVLVLWRWLSHRGSE